MKLVRIKVNLFKKPIEGSFALRGGLEQRRIKIDYDELDPRGWY